MTSEDRIPALKDTLGQVCQFATKLSRVGISIRFINHNDNGQWDKLTDVGTINSKMNTIKFQGGTALGGRLWDRVLKPLIIDQAASGMKLPAPVFVTIITDGGV